MVTDFLRNVVGEFRCRFYDWKHGVETCGNIPLVDLTLVGNNRSEGVYYHPSHPKFLYEVFGGLEINYREYTFIDFGSGKGRVLLVASEFRFKKIIGVEFAGELHDIAANNVRNYRSTTQKCVDIETVNADAAEFKLPDTPLVLYLFNPFGPTVLGSVLKNLNSSIALHPRDIFLIYMAPFHGEMVHAETPLRCVAESPYHKMYRFNANSYATKEP